MSAVDATGDSRHRASVRDPRITLALPLQDRPSPYSPGEVSAALATVAVMGVIVFSIMATLFTRWGHLMAEETIKVVAIGSAAIGWGGLALSVAWLARALRDRSNADVPLSADDASAMMRWAAHYDGAALVIEHQKEQGEVTYKTAMELCDRIEEAFMLKEKEKRQRSKR